MLFHQLCMRRIVYAYGQTGMTPWGRPHLEIQNLTGIFGFLSYEKYCI